MREHSIFTLVVYFFTTMETVLKKFLKNGREKNLINIVPQKKIEEFKNVINFLYAHICLYVLMYIYHYVPMYVSIYLGM